MDKDSNINQEEGSNDLFAWASKSTRRSGGEHIHSKITVGDMMLPDPTFDEYGNVTQRKFIPLLIFGVAMAFLEAAIVVFLRKIWGLTALFPIQNIFSNPDNLEILRIEFGREAATLVMLIAISCALGKNAWQRMAYLLFLFGVWDIFYYVWLWALIGWPSSLVTWDILFFLPYTLVSPVYAPIAVSIVMIFSGMMIIHAQKRQVILQSTPRFWIMELLAFSLVYVSMVWEYMIGTLKKNPAASETELNYPWLMLIIGLTIGLTAFLFLIGNCFKTKKFDFSIYVSRRS
jgi:hypothetical protein